MTKTARPVGAGMDMGAYEGGFGGGGNNNNGNTGGTGGQPPADDDGIQDGDTITGDDGFTEGTVNDITLNDGAFVDNTNGTINNVVMGENSRIDGGTVTGTVAGEEGAIITNALIDADTITGATIGTGSILTQTTAESNPDIDLYNAVTGSDGTTFELLHPIIQENDGDLKTVVDLIRDECNEFLVDSTSATNPRNTGKISITARNLGDTFIPANITKVTTTDEPNTIRFTPEGDLLVVRSGGGLHPVPGPGR